MQRVLLRELDGWRIDHTVTVGEPGPVLVHFTVQVDPTAPFPDPDRLHRQLAAAILTWDDWVLDAAGAEADEIAELPRRVTPGLPGRRGPGACAGRSAADSRPGRRAAPGAVRRGRGPRRRAALPAAAGRGRGIAVGGAAGAAQPGRRGARRAPLRDRPAGRQPVLALRLRTEPRSGDPAGDGRAPLGAVSGSLLRGVPRGLDRRGGHRPVQRARAAGRAGLARGGAAAGLRALRGAARRPVRAGSTSQRSCWPIPRRRRRWSSCSEPGSTRHRSRPSGPRRTDAALAGGRADRRGDRAGRGPDPARAARTDHRHPAHQLVPASGSTSRSRSTRVGAGHAVAPSPIRDLRVRPADGRCAPAVRAGGPRRAALVGSPAGLPHRDPGPGQGPGGEERGDRAGGREGRVRRAGGAARPGRRRDLLPDVHRRAARRHRQPSPGARRCRHRTWCATTATTPTWSSPRTRAPRGSPTWPTMWPPATGSGWATRSPPAARWATTTRRWGSPPVAHGRACAGISGSWAATPRPRTFTVVGVGDMSGDVFGNGMLLSKHIRLVAAFDHRHVFVDPDPDPACGYAERAPAVRAPPLLVGRLRPDRDQPRRRGVAAHREGGADRAGDPGGARAGRTGHLAQPARADPGRPAARRSTCCGTAASART